MKRTKYPVGLANWMMVASAGAFHRVHIDSAGLGTCVRMLKGTKLWFIASAQQDGSEIDAGSTARYFKELTPLAIAKKFSWEAVLLRPGSTL
jgi:hypothetical protein